MRALKRNCNPSEFDCYHAYTLFTDGNCAMKLSKKYGFPYVVTVRNTDVNDFFRKRPYLKARGIQIMKNAAAICFLSEAYRQQVYERVIPKIDFDFLMQKTYIIPNGIDDFWLTHLNSRFDISHLERIEKKTVRLVFAGRIDKNKNIPTIILAMDQLRAQGWKVALEVVGRVEDQREYHHFCDMPRVTCLPARPKEELIDIYRRNDIFVMPSFTESFGLVYAEAMSQGLPVVYSIGQGFDRQFEEGIVGYHADPHSATSVVEAVLRITEHYQQISEAAVMNANAFDWRKIVLRYEEIYKTIAKKAVGE